jgi:thymidylate kinase
MPLIYITGISGSGKSAVCTELKHRSYTAYDTDHDGIAFFYHNDTGEPVTERVAPEDRTPHWRSKHTWKARREDVKKLAEEAKNKFVFLCGVTNNDAAELWDLFDYVFALTLDEEVLRHRIMNRTGGGFGKNPHEFSEVLRWQRTANEDYEKLGATLIDATKPINQVVESILKRVESP